MAVINTSRKNQNLLFCIFHFQSSFFLFNNKKKLLDTKIQMDLSSLLFTTNKWEKKTQKELLLTKYTILKCCWFIFKQQKVQQTINLGWLKMCFFHTNDFYFFIYITDWLALLLKKIVKKYYVSPCIEINDTEFYRNIFFLCFFISYTGTLYK